MPKVTGKDLIPLYFMKESLNILSQGYIWNCLPTLPCSFSIYWEVFSLLTSMLFKVAPCRWWMTFIVSKFYLACLITHWEYNLRFYPFRSIFLFHVCYVIHKFLEKLLQTTWNHLPGKHDRLCFILCVSFFSLYRKTQRD